MTSIDTSIGLPRPLRFWQNGGKVLRLTMPLMVGSLTAAGLGIAKVTILAYSNDSGALYTLSMVQPAFILMLAFLESLAIANQVFSSKSYRNWPKGDIRRSTKLVSISGAVLTVLVAMAIYAAQYALPAGHVVLPVIPDMALFALSLLPYLLFEVRNAALRGQGKTGLALIPFAVLVVADLATTVLCITLFDLGFHAVLIGNVVGPLVALPLVSHFLNREIGDAPQSNDGSFKKHVIAMLIGVAAPTFLTTFVGALAAIVIFPTLALIGQDVASSFLLIIRLRVMFIIPAIAAGSAIAILINQGGQDALDQRNQPQRAEDSKMVLIHGVGLLVMIYLIATAGLFLARADIVGLVVPAGNTGLYETTFHLFNLLIATFFLFGIGTMLQVILEHLGHGLSVLVTTVLIESATIVAALVVLHRGDGLVGLTLVLNSAAAVSLLAFGVFFLRLVQSQRP